MVANEQQAQKIVISHIGGFAWPTALLLTTCLGIYGGCLGHLLTNPHFSWWALAGIAFCSYAAYTVVHDAVHGAITGMSIRSRWIKIGRAHV